MSETHHRQAQAKAVVDDSLSAAMVKLAAQMRAGAEELAERMTDTVYREIPEYRIAWPHLREMSKQFALAGIKTSAQMIRSGGNSLPSHLREHYQAVARMVAEQGFPLHAAIQAFHIGARVASEALMEYAAQQGEAIGAVHAHALKRIIEFTNESAAIYADAYHDAYQGLRERRKAAVGEIVSGLVLGAIEEDPISRAMSAGLRPAEAYGLLATPLAAKSSDAPDDGIDLDMHVAEVLRGSLWGSVQDVGVAIVPLGSPDWAGLRAAARAFEKVVHETTGTAPIIALGSPQSTLEEIVSSFEEAVSVIDVAKRLGLKGQVTSTELVVHRAVASAPHVARDLSRIVAPIMSGAGGEHADLLETLRTHLANGLSIQRTAEALGVHRNTVRARLRRIERLIGVPIVSARLALELALVAADLGFDT
jgi:hypothetical protein